MRLAGESRRADDTDGRLVLCAEMAAAEFFWAGGSAAAAVPVAVVTIDFTMSATRVTTPAATLLIT